MQSSCNSWISARVGVEEENIVFRPSPNFQKMKKYLKWRPENQSSPPNQDSPSYDTDVKQVLQPPLPLGPPPPESPPLVSPKKSPVSPFSQEGSPHYEISLEAIKKELDEEQTQDAADNAQTPLCRDFVRDICKRVPCHYRHKVIPDLDYNDLKKVYSFCHNFQNFGCLKSNCKFIHADSFEEHKFYRTGILPPECKKRKPNIQVPSPQTGSMYASEPPPNLQNETNTIGSVATHLPPPIPYSIFNGAKKENKAQFVNLGLPLPQQDIKISHVNNSDCETCQVVENRMEYANYQIEKLNKSLAETKLKVKLLEKRYCDLLSVLEYALSMTGDSQKNLI